MDIQEIQLDDSVAAIAADLQRRDKDGKGDEYYSWFDKATAELFGYTDGTKGAWVNEDGSQITPAVMLREGDCVQINTGIKTDALIMNNGEVSDKDITYAARVGFNFVGNSFPARLNIQDIQLDDTVAAIAADLQRRNKDGKGDEYYSWFDKATAELFGYTDGTKGAWVNEDGSAIDPAIILEPGEGVQINVGTKADALITTLAPIEL